MASGRRKSGIPALGWWLMAVGTIRSAIVWSCLFSSASLCLAVYPEMTGVQERAMAAWTLLSCTLCFLCAFNMDSKPLYVATFMSFVYVAGYLLVECFFYHSVHAASIAPYCFIAGTSMVWMLLQWNSHGRGRRPREASKQP
ncbi:erg28 like protein [Zea mays]|uniref:Erg28 like protein n=1 Tax=Zea mays TaxID=4577 RepID=K7UCX2_MAIZE|nr:erg28 like protein [Zea mays]AQK39996.1 Erg28 like protein [Zea mays]